MHLHTYIGKKLFCNLTLHRDRDNDKNGGNCAGIYGQGWWYNSCYNAKLTGEVHKTQTTSTRGIRWKSGGERGISSLTWKEAEMLLVPN